MNNLKQSLEEPLISVVIPTYNRADLISISINSAINQSYKNIEIILIDDGSTDNTKEVVQAIHDSRIRYIKHPKNLGGNASRNAGIEAAKGEYIAFLDSDDTWVENKLELQIASIQKYLHKEKVVSYTQIFYSDKGINNNTYHTFNEEFFMPKRGKKSDETLAEYLFCNRGEMFTSTLLLHKSLLLSTRFRENLRKHQEYDLCLRLEAQGVFFSFLDKPLTIWNADPSYEHVGRIPNYRLSENFIYENKAYISPKAATAFLLQRVLPSLIKNRQRKIYAQKLILNALLQKLISLKKFVQLTYQIFIPEPVQKVWRKWKNSIVIYNFDKTS